MPKLSDQWETPPAGISQTTFLLGLREGLPAFLGSWAHSGAIHLPSASVVTATLTAYTPLTRTLGDPGPGWLSQGDPPTDQYLQSPSLQAPG